MDNRAKREEELLTVQEQVVKLTCEMWDLEEQLAIMVKDNAETYMLRDKLS